MKIITISREFGSGGREVGKRLADALGFDYYDKEILTAIARETGLNEDYVEKTLNDPTFWHFLCTFIPPLPPSPPFRMDWKKSI